MEAARAKRVDATRSAARILAAVRELGAEPWSIEEVARRAGVGPATVYRHFATRDRLLQVAAAHAVVDELAPHVAAALADPSARHGLHVVADRIVEAGSATPDGGPRDANTVAAIIERFLEVHGDDLGRLLARAQEAGEIRGDIEPADIAPIVGAMLAGMALPAATASGPARYVALVFDALDPLGASPLPQRTAVERGPD